MLFICVVENQNLSSHAAPNNSFYRSEGAKIKRRVYPHLLRHSVATTLLKLGMPIDQIQKFLGHSKLETTQVYAESTTEMIKESYRRVLSEQRLISSYCLR